MASGALEPALGSRGEGGEPRPVGALVIRQVGRFVRPSAARLSKAVARIKALSSRRSGAISGTSAMAGRPMTPASEVTSSRARGAAYRIGRSGSTSPSAWRVSAPVAEAAQAPGEGREGLLALWARARRALGGRASWSASETSRARGLENACRTGQCDRRAVRGRQGLGQRHDGRTTQLAQPKSGDGGASSSSSAATRAGTTVERTRGAAPRAWTAARRTDQSVSVRPTSPARPGRRRRRMRPDREPRPPRPALSTRGRPAPGSARPRRRPRPAASEPTCPST